MEEQRVDGVRPAHQRSEPPDVTASHEVRRQEGEVGGATAHSVQQGQVRHGVHGGDMTAPAETVTADAIERGEHLEGAKRE